MGLRRNWKSAAQYDRFNRHRDKVTFMLVQRIRCNSRRRAISIQPRNCPASQSYSGWPFGAMAPNCFLRARVAPQIQCWRVGGTRHGGAQMTAPHLMEFRFQAPYSKTAA